MKIHNIEQGTPEWFKVRAGVITGTGLEHLLKSDRLKNGALGVVAQRAMLNYIYELVGGELSYDENAPQVGTYLMESGKTYEELAKIKYEELFKIKVTNVGFITTDEGWLGLSPDGVVYSDDGVIRKAVEIKTPLGNNSKNFYKYIIEDKIPDEYLAQVIQYFIVIDTLEELDFCVFNPNYIKKDKQLWVKNIKRADLQTEIEEAQKRIKEARAIWIEVLTKFLKEN